MKEDEGKEWDSDKVFELIRMEERLKKRIDELKILGSGSLDYTLNELQKILGEK